MSYIQEALPSVAGADLGATRGNGMRKAASGTAFAGALQKAMAAASQGHSACEMDANAKRDQSEVGAEHEADSSRAFADSDTASPSAEDEQATRQASDTASIAATLGAATPVNAMQHAVVSAPVNNRGTTPNRAAPNGIATGDQRLLTAALSTALPQATVVSARSEQSRLANVSRAEQAFGLIQANEPVTEPLLQLGLATNSRSLPGQGTMAAPAPHESAGLNRLAAHDSAGLSRLAGHEPAGLSRLAGHEPASLNRLTPNTTAPLAPSGKAEGMSALSQSHRNTVEPLRWRSRPTVRGASISARADMSLDAGFAGARAAVVRTTSGKAAAGLKQAGAMATQAGTRFHNPALSWNGSEALTERWSGQWRLPPLGQAALSWPWVVASNRYGLPIGQSHAARLEATYGDRVIAARINPAAHGADTSQNGAKQATAALRQEQAATSAPASGQDQVSAQAAGALIAAGRQITDTAGSAKTAVITAHAAVNTAQVATNTTQAAVSPATAAMQQHIVGSELQHQPMGEGITAATISAEAAHQATPRATAALMTAQTVDQPLVRASAEQIANPILAAKPTAMLPVESMPATSMSAAAAHFAAGRNGNASVANLAATAALDSLQPDIAAPIGMQKTAQAQVETAHTQLSTAHATTMPSDMARAHAPAEHAAAAASTAAALAGGNESNAQATSPIATHSPASAETLLNSAPPSSVAARNLSIDAQIVPSAQQAMPDAVETSKPSHSRVATPETAAMPITVSASGYQTSAGARPITTSMGMAAAPVESTVSSVATQPTPVAPAPQSTPAESAPQPTPVVFTPLSTQVASAPQPTRDAFATQPTPVVSVPQPALTESAPQQTPTAPQPTLAAPASQPTSVAPMGNEHSGQALATATTITETYQTLPKATASVGAAAGTAPSELAADQTPTAAAVIPATQTQASNMRLQAEEPMAQIGAELRTNVNELRLSAAEDARHDHAGENKQAPSQNGAATQTQVETQLAAVGSVQAERPFHARLEQMAEGQPQLEQGGSLSQWENLARHVRRSINASPDGTAQISISVKPEALGEVQMSIAWRDGQMKARFVMESEGARRLLAAGLPHLQTRLAGEGISLGEVTLEVASASQATVAVALDANAGFGARQEQGGQGYPMPSPEGNGSFGFTGGTGGFAGNAAFSGSYSGAGSQGQYEQNPGVGWTSSDSRLFGDQSLPSRPPTTQMRRQTGGGTVDLRA